MKVSLGIVHGQEINSWFFHSMVGILAQANPTNHVLDDHLCIRSGPLLSMGRGVLAGTFLEKTDADALLMLDTDMVFTPQMIYQMIETFAQAREQHPDLGVLGGLAFISSDPRNAGPKPNIYLPGKHPGQLLQMGDYPPNALVEVAAAGAACLIVAREVFEKFAGEGINPFHHVPILDWGLLAHNVSQMEGRDQIANEIRYAVERADQLGEDLSFCKRVREAGYRIFVHTGLVFDHAKSTLLGEQEFRTAYGLEAQPSQEDTE